MHIYLSNLGSAKIIMKTTLRKVTSGHSHPDTDKAARYQDQNERSNLRMIRQRDLLRLHQLDRQLRFRYAIRKSRK